MVRVLVVGDVTLDQYWFSKVERISPEAPVPVALVHSEEDRMGGAANVALNTASLGADTTLLSVIGDDEAGCRIQDLLSASAIRSKVQKVNEFKTTLKLRVISQQQQLMRVDFESAPDHEILLSLMDVYEQELSGHDVVVLSDYGKGGLGHVSRMIKLAIQEGIPVLVDPKGSDFSIYSGATLISPNLSEFALVAGYWRNEDELSHLAEQLRLRLKLQALLLTRGDEGMSLFTAAGRHHVKAVAKEVFDVSGAGDTVIAALAVMLGAGSNLEDAVCLANQAAGIVVGKLGTASVTPAELSFRASNTPPLP